MRQNWCDMRVNGLICATCRNKPVIIVRFWGMSHGHMFLSHRVNAPLCYWDFLSNRIEHLIMIKVYLYIPVYLLFLQVAKNNLQLTLRGCERSEQVRGRVACEASEIWRGTGRNFWAIRPQKVNFGNRKHIITQGAGYFTYQVTKTSRFWDSRVWMRPCSFSLVFSNINRRNALKCLWNEN